MAEEQLELPFDGAPSPPTRAAMTRWAEENEVELIFFDPPQHFDHAILGVVHGFGQEAAVLYDEEKVLAAMRRDMGGDLSDDAEEWFSFNTIGAFLGEATPRFLIRPWEDDVDHDAIATATGEDAEATEEETDVEET